MLIYSLVNSHHGPIVELKSNELLPLPVHHGVAVDIVDEGGLGKACVCQEGKR